MKDVLVVAIVFAVPISAILSSVWLKAKRLEFQSGGDRKLTDRVDAVAAENAELRKRVEVLETIVTSDTPSGARVRVAHTPDNAVEEARVMAEERPRAARLG